MAENQIEFFRALSAKHGLPLQFVIKEFHLMELLEKIAIKSDGGLILKGGTALNRVYATGISRFSEDLDFDYAAKKTAKQKTKFLNSMMKMEGYSIEKPRMFRNRLRFDCFFRNEMDKKDVVRAEFNLSFSAIVGRAEKSAVVSEISGKTIIGVAVYSLEDMIARKILALHNRTEGKDMFDLAVFIHKADAKLVIKSLKMMLKHEKSKKSAKDVINGCIEKLGSLDIKEVKALTNNYIPLQMRPDWNELAATLKMRLGAFLDS